MMYVRVILNFLLQILGGFLGFDPTVRHFLTIFPACTTTVKLDDKERFDKEQIGVKEPFPVTNLPFTS